MRLVDSREWQDYCQGPTTDERIPYMWHFHGVASPSDIDDLIDKVTRGDDSEAIGAMFLLIDFMYLRDRRLDPGRMRRWLAVCQEIVDGPVTSASLFGLATNAIRTSALEPKQMDKLRDATISSRGYKVEES